MFGALRAFRVGQFACVHMHMCVRVCEGGEEMDRASLPRHGGPLNTPTPTPHTPLCPCLTAQSYNSHYHKDTLSSDRRLYCLKAIKTLKLHLFAIYGHR